MEIIAMIELLLKKDVPKLGKTGSYVKVKPGYARNYLIPKGLGVIATTENIRLVEIAKKRMLQQEALEKEQLKEVAKDLEKAACNIEVKANEDDTLFGSVTYDLIAAEYKKLGFNCVKADNLKLEDPDVYPIKSLGIFPIEITLHEDVVAKSKVWVVKEQESGE